MSSDVTENESLDIFALFSSVLTPRLLLSGGDNFCLDWQANVTAFNAPAEVVESPELTPPTSESESEVEIETEVESKTIAQGGFVSWLVLMALILGIGGRVRHAACGTA